MPWTPVQKACCVKKSLRVVRQLFGDQVLSNRTDHIWSPHSPDLNPPDFFLWGYLKDRVYKDNPRTLDALKAAITAEISAIAPATCRKFMENFKKRAQVCFERQGRHLEHVIKRAGH